MIKGLTYMHDATWKEVFETWQNQEGSDPAWQKLALEKGWPDWQSWRGNSAKIAGLPDLKWKIYQIDSPSELVPKMIVGPYKVWRDQFPYKYDLTKGTFHELIDILTTKINQIDKGEEKINHIKKMMRNFPENTQLIGIHLSGTELLICFEGTHRSAAITLAKTLAKPINFTAKPSIAITEINVGELEKLQNMLTSGSQRQ